MSESISLIENGRALPEAFPNSSVHNSFIGIDFALVPGTLAFLDLTFFVFSYF